MRGTTVWKRHICTVIGALAAGAASANAQVVNTSTTASGSTPATRAGSAHIIEWDLPFDADFNPGAVAVDTRGEDNNRAWFVTRIGGQKVYRFDFGPSLMKNNGNAQWTSWDLVPEANTGGVAKLRPSHDRRYAIVRTSTSLQEVDTQACVAGTKSAPAGCASALRRWDFKDPETPEETPFVSDIAVDDFRRIFTVGRSQGFPDGYLQMVIATKVAFTSSTTPVNAPAGSVTRWNVAGVDQCAADGISGMCNSGIDLQPDNKNQNLIYFSDQGFADASLTVMGAIGELDINTNQIRRWPMPLDHDGNQVAQPRQLKIASNGTIWTLTASGHIVSLNPKNSSGCSAGYYRMTTHRIPPGMLQNDGFGIAPDSDVVGYTDANNNKVGMLLPHDGGVCVKPIVEGTFKRDVPSTVTAVPTTIMSDVTPGIPKNVLKQTTTKPDGTYVEAVIDMAPPNPDPTMAPPDSMSPLGITPVKWKGEGTFFYAVGFTPGLEPGIGPSPAKRVGFVRLGVPDHEKINNARDDDDTDDGLDATMHPTWHTSAVGDRDADGVPDEYDTPTARENMTSYAATPVATGTTGDYTVTTTASTLALIATAQADDLTATIAVEVYNAMGLLVASSGALPGVPTVTVTAPGAGTFTIRVRNVSGRTVNITPTMLVRDPLS